MSEHSELPGEKEIGPDAPSPPVARTTRIARWIRTPSTLRTVVAVGTIFGLVLVGWAGYRAYTLYDAYGQAMSDVEALEVYVGTDPATLDRESISAIHQHLSSLDAQLERIDDATSLPIGAGVVGRLPWVGPRYIAGRQLVSTGRLLSHAGVTASDVGMGALDAFDAGGVSATVAADQETWLQVVLQHEGELRTALSEIDQARTERAAIDVRYLPEGARIRMDRLDRILNRYDYGNIADQYFPLAKSLLGADAPVRYLVLFQNPAELRPSGGFPGTMGLVTIDNGQLADYQIFDAHTLSDVYIGQQHPPRAQPWAIQEYFPSPSLVLHDATWWADFPRSGQTIYEMYQQTGWPAIDGVVAVQPSVISALVRASGEFTIEVNGEERLITPENVYDEIERLRRLHREGLGPDGQHKEVLELIGTEILERFEHADKGALVHVARDLQHAADVRDLQIYMHDAAMQAWLDERNWTGRIVPLGAGPTLSVVLANVVTNKASMRLIPDVTMTMQPATDGRRLVTLEMWLTNTGTNDEDPFYAGFSRWWVEVTLPAGGTWTASHPEPMPDPESPDGGSYLIAVFPQETGYLSVTFSMPDTPELLLRREPGVVPLNVAVLDAGCGDSTQVVLNADTRIALADICR